MEIFVQIDWFFTSPLIPKQGGGKKNKVRDKAWNIQQEEIRAWKSFLRAFSKCDKAGIQLGIAVDLALERKLHYARDRR